MTFWEFVHHHPVMTFLCFFMLCITVANVAESFANRTDHVEEDD